jgi:hypothetical protein
MLPLFRFFILLVAFLVNSNIIDAQKIFGHIHDESGNQLPFSSIMIKGTSKGVTANNNAIYSFSVKPGVYKIVCQHIGYETVEKEIKCSSEENVELNFVLKVQQLMMKELVIKSGDENPAYEIIRQAIKKRSYYNNEVKGFICDLYSKDVIKLRNLPEKFMGQKIEKKEVGVDSSGKGIIYLSEAVSKIYKDYPDKFKMDVLSSRVSGSNSFGFTFPAFINMYDNNVDVFNGGINPRGFVSPIADGAIHYYKYKILGTFIENGKMINSIKVTPRRKFEPLFSGVINISDEDFRIYSFELMVTKSSQLEILDTLKITQIHVPVGQESWRVKNQVLYFNIKFFNIDAIGNSLTVYSNYEINPTFNKKFFDRIVVKYDTAVNKKTSNYWDTIRPIPLEYDEQKDYRVKDSIMRYNLENEFAKNNIDSLKKKQGKLKPFKIFISGFNRTHYSTKGNFDWGVQPLLLNTQYNLAEGVVTEGLIYFSKAYRKDKLRLTVKPNLRYGFSNNHFNSWLDIEIRKRKINQENTLNRVNWFLSGGKKVVQYNNDNPIPQLFNSISTLFYGKNAMKTYEKYFTEFNVVKKYESGLVFKVNTSYENRLPIFNTTQFSFYKKDNLKFSENYPVEKVGIDEIVNHQAVIASFGINYKPGQKYIQLPNSKIPMGSKFPVIGLTYKKGFYGVLGSDVDFDKWNLDVYDDKNLNLIGLIKYKFTIGGFTNSKKIFIQDYKHFNSTAVRATASYVNGFQLMSSYKNSNTAHFYSEGHVEHHFNGLLTNKLPLLKKWNWNLVAGANAYFINTNDNYAEYFIGLENIFKIFRIDFVSGYQNKKYNTSSLVLGIGGLLGNGFGNSNNAGGSNVSVSF